MKKISFLILASCFAFSFAFAQKDIAKFFPAAAVPSGGANNVQQLVNGYITPIAEDFGSLVNNGWYTTAATHKKFGFDFNVTMNTITANSSSKYFSPVGLQGVQASGSTGGNNGFPTAYGPEKDFGKLNFTAGPNTVIPSVPPGTFLGPDGGNITKDIPVGSIAVPTMQLGLGLFANTDLRMRYTPAITFNGTKLENWGFGVHHDIKQHIPGLKMLPFSLSVFLAYSQLKASTDLSGLYTGSGQQGLAETKAYTGQVLISKSLAIVTFYGGIGYNSSTTNYSIKGTYNVDRAFIAGDVAVPLLQSVNLTDPFKNEFSKGSFRATGGIRFNFGPITLNGDYSVVNAKGLFTAGFGFTVR